MTVGRFVRRAFVHPAILIVPIVAAVQVPAAAQVLFKTQLDTVMPDSGFSTVNQKGTNASWQVTPVSNGVSYAASKGDDNEKALAITSSQDNNNVVVSSPRAAIQAGKTYLYKGLYQSSVPFTLLMRSGAKDGTSKLTIIQSYVKNMAWTGASHAFVAAADATSVQFVYEFQGKGTLTLNNPYLEPSPDDVYIAPQPNLTTNIVPNATLTSTDGQTPDGWSTYSYGTNQPAFSYVANDGGSPYLHAQVANYKSGEAKWQYPAVAAWPGQLFRFGVKYRSSRGADVVAEYATSSGEKFETLTTLPPANDWTSYDTNFTAPSGATNVFVSVVLHGNGTIDTAAYSLYDTSDPTARYWQRPLVSITFDDGWESAFVNAVPLLDQYGYKATFYLNPSSLDTPSFMTSDQATSLQNDGQELASHGYEHDDFTTLGKSSLEYQLSRAHDYFTQVRGETAVDFATPFGASDAEVQYFAHKYYASQRGTDNGINTKQNFDPFNLVTLYIGNDTSLATINDALAETKALNGWLILIYHRIDTVGSGEPRITPSAFADQLGVINKSGLTVEPVQTALQEVTHE